MHAHTLFLIHHTSVLTGHFYKIQPQTSALYHLQDIYINIYSCKVSLMKLSCIWVSSFVFPLSNTFKHSLCLQMKSIEWKQKYGYPQDRQMTLGPHVHIALLMRSDDKWSLLTELNVSINSHSWSSVIARVCRTDILILWGLFHCVLAGWDTWLVTWQKRK